MLTFVRPNRQPTSESTYLFAYYDGRPTNKLQNGIMLLIFKI